MLIGNEMISCFLTRRFLFYPVLKSLFQPIDVLGEGLSTRLFPNEVSIYSGKLPLEFVLLIANIPQFFQTFHSLLFSVLKSKRLGGRAQRTFCWYNASYENRSRIALLFVPPRCPLLQCCLSSQSSLRLAQLVLLSSGSPWSPDLATVRAERAPSCTISSLSEAKGLVFVMFSMDLLRCRFVTLFILASLNLEVLNTVWTFYIEEWKISFVMSSWLQKRGEFCTH